MVPGDEILRIIETYEKDPQVVADALVAAANQAGGKDNITVVFVPGSGFASANGHSTTRRMGPTATQLTPAGSVEVRRRKQQDASVWLPILSAVLVLGGVLFWWLTRAPAPGPHAEAGVLRVGLGQQYSSIAAAIEAAHEGDKIIVEPGIYAGNLTLKSGVALFSAKPRLAEIQARGTAVDAETVTGARLSGFRIAPDSADALEIGLLARDASIEIDDSEISGAADAGIVIQGNSTATISKNLIRDNKKAGVRVESTTIPDMQGNRICDNGHDIDPASALAADANTTGSCSGGQAPSKPTKAEVKTKSTAKGKKRTAP
jgi:hypothetical protein